MNHDDLTFIISIFAILISAYSLYSQRRHNTLSFKPIPVIIKYNYSNHLSVKLWNKGTGPFILKSLDFDGQSNLIDALPKEVKIFKFVEYVNQFDGRAIASGESLNLIEFKIRKTDNIELKGYREALAKIKKHLHGKKVNVKYENIFGKKETYSSVELNFQDSKDELLINTDRLELKNLVKTKG